MALTYEPIATTTLGSATTDTTFSSISGSYTDLILVMNVFTSSDGATPQLQFNSDTGTNYSTTFMEGNGGSASSIRVSSRSYIQLSYNIGGNSTNPQPVICHLQNYSNSTTNKTVLSRWNSATGGTYPGTNAAVSLWRSTAAITSIKIYVGAGNFNTGSTFTLYGIKAA